MQTSDAKLCTTAKRSNSSLEGADQKCQEKAKLRKFVFQYRFFAVDEQTESIKNVEKRTLVDFVLLIIS